MTLTIIYKIEKEPIYFLIEHQSTVDKNMLERIGEYVGQIMQKGVKEGTYPIVVPIVIYTGKQKWNVKTKFSDKQYKKENYEEYEINLKYNLIKAEDYTKEELLKKESLFAYIMIIEKSMKTKEIADNLFKIAKKIKQEDDKELFKKIARNVLRPEIGEKQTKELIKKIDGKEGLDMSPLVDVILNSEYEKRLEGIEEGRKEGIQEGRKEGLRRGLKAGKERVLNIAKKMLERKMEIQDIEEITGLTKKELQNLVKN